MRGRVNDPTPSRRRYTALVINPVLLLGSRDVVCASEVVRTTGLPLRDEATIASAVLHRRKARRSRNTTAGESNDALYPSDARERISHWL